MASIKKEKLRLNEGKLETVIYHKLSDVDFVHQFWREKWPDFFPIKSKSGAERLIICIVIRQGVNDERFRAQFPNVSNTVGISALRECNQ